MRLFVLRVTYYLLMGSLPFLLLPWQYLAAQGPSWVKVAVIHGPESPGGPINLVCLAGWVISLLVAFSWLADLESAIACAKIGEPQKDKRSRG